MAKLIDHLDLSIEDRLTFVECPVPSPRAARDRFVSYVEQYIRGEKVISYGLFRMISVNVFEDPDWGVAR